jgi:hypothetical protein
MLRQCYVVGLAIILVIVRPVAASDANSAKAVIKAFMDDNVALATLFADSIIEPAGHDKAYVFAEKDATRYAVIAVPVKSNIDMTQIAEPLCRSRLMTPEAIEIKKSLYATTDDNRLIKTVLNIWQNAGQVERVKMNTRILSDAGMVLSICKAASDDIRVSFTSIDETLLHQAEMIIARQLYDQAAYREVMTRMNAYIQRNNAPEAKAFLGLAMLKQAEYELAFMLDEQFDSSGLSDPWLETEYQSVFAEAVDTYFTSALANN